MLRNKQNNFIIILGVKILLKVENYLNPDQANAPRPTANVKHIIDPLSVVEFDAKYIKIV